MSSVIYHIGARAVVSQTKFDSFETEFSMLRKNRFEISGF